MDNIVHGYGHDRGYRSHNNKLMNEKKLIHRVEEMLGRKLTKSEENVFLIGFAQGVQHGIDVERIKYEAEVMREAELALIN